MKKKAVTDYEMKENLATSNWLREKTGKQLLVTSCYLKEKLATNSKLLVSFYLNLMNIFYLATRSYVRNDSFSNKC